MLAGLIGVHLAVLGPDMQNKLQEQAEQVIIVTYSKHYTQKAFYFATQAGNKHLVGWTEQGRLAVHTYLGCWCAMASRNRAKSGTLLAIGPDTGCNRSLPLVEASP